MATKRATVLVLVVTLAAGCVKRIPLPYEQVQEGSRVWVRTTQNRVQAGDVTDRRPDRFVLRSFEGKLDTLLVADVISIHARPQALDEAGRLITEREIDSLRSHRNLLVYSIGGTALSLGTSFYLGSFLRRHVSSGQDLAQWGVTGLGSAIGLALFAQAGNRRDRSQAIEAIRELRKEQAAKELERQKTRQQELEEELQRLRELQREQEEELERLKKALERERKEGPDPAR
ncbi:MAG: hypothetical protein ONB23_11215 [candidate division KSB1 bacterium]|nr:hypothetical protein [candidate division KSB1 bacterium]